MAESFVPGRILHLTAASGAMLGAYLLLAIYRYGAEKEFLENLLPACSVFSHARAADCRLGAFSHTGVPLTLVLDEVTQAGQSPSPCRVVLGVGEPTYSGVTGVSITTPRRWPSRDR